MTSVSSLYVHVPFCRHLCNYCDFYKQKFDNPRAQREEFSAYLRASWERHESIMRTRGVQWSELQTVYLGGGTPSLWDVEGAEVLASLWKERVSLSKSCEFTFEVDPGAWTHAGLLAWERIGVNRYSVGTQSLDAGYLRVLDRDHNRAQTFALLEHLRGKNFSVDFLLGAPQVNKEREVLRELAELLSYEPKHLSLYILQPAAGYKLKARIPTDEVVGREYLSVSEYLRSRGFNHYEVSNFSLPGFESKHNLKYWLGESVAALGPTGTGYFSLSKEQAYRYKWKPGRAEIEDEVLGVSELELERLYLRLRLNLPFVASEIMSSPVFSSLLVKWQGRGLVEGLDGAWRMRPQGWVVLDSLMDEVFAATSRK